MKKKVSILITLLFFFAMGYSQIKKGTIVLSGKTDLNFLFSNTEISRDSIATNKMKSEQFGFNLGVGYFVGDNISVALSEQLFWRIFYSQIIPNFFKNKNNRILIE